MRPVRERPTGTRSAPTREKRHRRGMRGVLANRLRTAETPNLETPNLAAQGQSVSRKTVAEVPLAGLSFSLLVGATAGLEAHEHDRDHRRKDRTMDEDAGDHAVRCAFQMSDERAARPKRQQRSADS